MTGLCPKCGGSELRQITPGFFECTSSVVLGVIQRPDAGPMPAIHPCSYGFQVGTVSSSEPCWCGRDSIGSCVDCARRLCGLHGTTTGSFLCGDCFNTHSQRKLAAAEEEAAARAAQESTRAALVARFRASRDPREIMTLFIENETKSRMTPVNSYGRDLHVVGRSSRHTTSSLLLDGAIFISPVADLVRHTRVFRTVIRAAGTVKLAHALPLGVRPGPRCPATTVQTIFSTAPAEFGRRTHPDWASAATSIQADLDIPTWSCCHETRYFGRLKVRGQRG
jgi:hypothetical protein